MPDYAEKLKDHVGRRITELREDGGYTQADVAERLSTTVPNYQRVEYGVQNVTLETLAKIAKALGVSVADFFAPLNRPRKRKRVGRPRKRPS